MTRNKNANGPANMANDATSDCTRLLADWRATTANRIAAFHAEPEKRTDDHAAADEQTGRIAREAWATPVTDPAGLRLRAEIVRDEMWPDLDDSGSARFEGLLAGKEPGDDPVVGIFAERAVAELVKAVLWTAKAVPARSEPTVSRDWLAQLRDEGPNGAAPDARHAALWGAILDLRGVRDVIENAVGQMTAKLDSLADETTLTHAIAAGWEPEDGGPDDEASASANSDTAGGGAPCPSQETLDSTRDWQLRSDIEQLWSGLTTMHVLIHSRRDEHGGLDQDTTTSLLFCVDSLNSLSEKIDELLDAVEVRHKPRQPADTSAPS